MPRENPYPAEQLAGTLPTFTLIGCTTLAATYIIRLLLLMNSVLENKSEIKSLQEALWKPEALEPTPETHEMINDAVLFFHFASSAITCVFINALAMLFSPRQECVNLRISSLGRFIPWQERELKAAGSLFLFLSIISLAMTVSCLPGFVLHKAMTKVPSEFLNTDLPYVDTLESFRTNGRFWFSICFASAVIAKTRPGMLEALSGGINKVSFLLGANRREDGDAAPGLNQ